MGTSELLLELYKRGAWVWIEDNRLRISAPKGALDNLRASISLRRGELWTAVIEIGRVSAEERLYQDRWLEYGEALAGTERGEGPHVGKPEEIEELHRTFAEVSDWLNRAERRAKRLQQLVGFTVGARSVARRWIIQLETPTPTVETDNEGNVLEVFTI